MRDGFLSYLTYEKNSTSKTRKRRVTAYTWSIAFGEGGNCDPASPYIVLNQCKLRETSQVLNCMRIPQLGCWIIMTLLTLTAFPWQPIRFLNVWLAQDTQSVYRNVERVKEKVACLTASMCGLWQLYQIIGRERYRSPPVPVKRPDGAGPMNAVGSNCMQPWSGRIALVHSNADILRVGSDCLRKSNTWGLLGQALFAVRPSWDLKYTIYCGRKRWNCISALLCKNFPVCRDAAVERTLKEHR